MKRTTILADERLLAEVTAVAKRRGVTTRPLVTADFARVTELLKTHVDARLGFVDAAVVAVAERLGEQTLYTLDRRHFAIVRPRHVDALTLRPD